MPRHFLSQNDLNSAEIHQIFLDTTARKERPHSQILAGRSLVMFFEKSSTRTRLSFEIGMTQLGGHAVYLDIGTSQVSRGESLEDTARVVSRYADMIMARVNSHDTLERLAANSAIPVINGLSDAEHPCQSMTDLFTIMEHKGRLAGLKISYVGDGNNNVAHSLMVGAALLGAHVALACPQGLQPQSKYVELAMRHASDTGGLASLTSDPIEAVRDADVVYTDVWISMGREAERAERLAALTEFRVSASLTQHAKPDFVFMHCLPAHVGEEVTPDVAYGEHSVIFDQAENRLHVQKALMMFLLTASKGEGF